MIVTLDGQRVNADFEPGCTLETLIAQVRTAHDNCLIVSVSENGRCLRTDELPGVLQQPVAEGAQIDLESGNARALAQAALTALSQEFVAAARLQPALADRLAAGQTADAVRDVGQVVGLWQMCQAALVQCSGLLGCDLTQREVGGRTVQGWFEGAVGKLQELRGALDSRDLVLLADLVRYELPELCTAWSRMLGGLAEQVDDA